MRQLNIFSGVLSILLLGVSTIGVQAQNYVAPQNYNNPGVVVNMDVINNTGMGQMTTRAPVLQQPLAPPLAPPPMLRPPPPRLPPDAPRPTAMMGRNAAPMPLASPAPVAPMAYSPPVQRPPEQPPQPIQEATAPTMPAPVAAPAPIAQPEPFSTRELAESAPPLPAPTMKKETKIAAKKENDTSSYKETSVREDALAPSAAPAPQASEGRQLLAQAREEANGKKHEERKVVLFDDVPAPPEAEAPLTAIEKKTDKKLKSQAVNDAIPPAPSSENLQEPHAAAMPPALPTPIVKGETLTAPTDSEEKIAALKPQALPDVAPASIPNREAVKKAETVVDDFEAYRLLFASSSSELKPTETAILDGVVAKLKQDENIKLQLRAYAAGTPDNKAAARRLSLARALAVRTYLAQKGIATSRLDVRALGMGSAAMGDVATRADIPADRVDMVLTR